MLRFKKKFLDAIRRGEKTQTLRCWKFNRFRAGQKSFIPGIGPIFIESSEEVQLEELTDADAIPDGFSTIVALRQELEEIYGTPHPGKMYRIRFHLLELEPENAEEGSEIPETVSSESGLTLHQVKKSEAERFWTPEETAEKLLKKCQIHRNSCDWNHEPGKALDFFALFLQSPRDERGVPTLDGYRLQGLVRNVCSPEEWESLRWLVSDVCRSWTEWQYAIEKWLQK